MIYKVRVILDTKHSVFRDILIKDKQSLWNLHLAIKSAFNLPGDDLSSFYHSDDDWSEGTAVPLEDMSDDGDGEVMSDVYISEAFEKKGYKMLFKYGSIDLWEFFCELQNIEPEKPGANYPQTSYRFGNVPLKAPSATKEDAAKKKKVSKPVVEDEEFENEESEFEMDDYDDISDVEEDLGFEDENIANEEFDDEDL